MSGIFKTRCSGLFLTNLSRTSIPQIQGKFKLTQPLIIATFYSSYEQTNIFLYACAATVIAAIIFSKGSPYRQPLYRNGGQNHKMLHRSKSFSLLLPQLGAPLPHSVPQWSCPSGRLLRSPPSSSCPSTSRRYHERADGDAAPQNLNLRFLNDSFFKGFRR